MHSITQKIEITYFPGPLVSAALWCLGSWRATFWSGRLANLYTCSWSTLEKTLKTK